MSERRERPQLKDVYGKLPDWAIKEYIEREIIKISPLKQGWRENIDSISIDFHLGGPILVPKSGGQRYIDVKKGVDQSYYERIDLGEGQTHIILPSQFIIAPTVESLELPDDIVGWLEGKSSLARLGIVIHMTSGRFDPGWKGNPVLEIKNNTDVPVIIYGGWPVCAFSFEKLAWPVEKPYGGDERYTDGTLESKVHLTNPNL